MVFMLVSLMMRVLCGVYIGVTGDEGVMWWLCWCDW